MSNFQISLQSHSPELYRYVTEKLLEQFHIHSYDIHLSVLEQEDGLNIIVQYGMNYDHKREQFFTKDSLEQKDEKLHQFILETGEDCKKVLIDDYFKMMTP